MEKELELYILLPQIRRHVKKFYLKLSILLINLESLLERNILALLFMVPLLLKQFLMTKNFSKVGEMSLETLLQKE